MMEKASLGNGRGGDRQEEGREQHENAMLDF